MASNWSSRSSGQNGLKPRIFTHSSFRPRFLFNETTMRALNPLTVYAVILLKKPIYNCIVRDTILRSGARSSFLTRANQKKHCLSRVECPWSIPRRDFAFNEYTSFRNTFIQFHLYRRYSKGKFLILFFFFLSLCWMSINFFLDIFGESILGAKTNVKVDVRKCRSYLLAIQV